MLQIGTIIYDKYLLQRDVHHFNLNNWVSKIFNIGIACYVTSTFCHFQKEEIYWPDVGTTQMYAKLEIEAKKQKNIGKHTVVTMELKDGESVCTHSLPFPPKKNVPCRKH